MAESEITVQEISTFYTPVANHLQAHIYKSVNTGLFLSSNAKELRIKKRKNIEFGNTCGYKCV